MIYKLSVQTATTGPRKAAKSEPSLIHKLFRWYLNSGLRGRTRVTFALARRLRTLQAVPITISQRQRLWVDLRDGLSHDLLAGSPWQNVPWEIEEQLAMKRLVRRGDTVFDIGAHIGLHTVLLSELIGPTGMLHAFEPNSTKGTALAITIAALPNAALHRCALGDSTEQRELFIPEDESMASLSDWTHGRGGPIRRERCQVKRIDDLVTGGELAAPDFIKCDVEGNELGVLLGARSTLNQASAPIVLYEANASAARGFGWPVSASTDFLLNLDRARYSIFTVHGDALLQPVATLAPSSGHTNLIAVPAARGSRLPHDLHSAG